MRPDSRSRVAHLFAIVAFVVSAVNAASSSADGPMVSLTGHTLPVVARATPLNANMQKAAAPLTLTITLRRSDEPGFARYLQDVYDPKSTQYRAFLSPVEVSNRFGPTEQEFSEVLGYFRDRGFTVLDTPANRLTLTVSG